MIDNNNIKTLDELSDDIFKNIIIKINDDKLKKRQIKKTILNKYPRHKRCNVYFLGKSIHFRCDDN